MLEHLIIWHAGPNFDQKRFPYKCPVCEQLFASRNSLRIHWNEKHAELGSWKQTCSKIQSLYEIRNTESHYENFMIYLNRNGLEPKSARSRDGQKPKETKESQC